MAKEKENIFFEKDIEELSFSKFFERERVKNNLTLKNLSKKTGVSFINLKNIESGFLDKLPAKIYVKDFLKRCSKEFGIDSDILINLYEKELKNIDNKIQRVEKIKIQKFKITPKFLTYTILFSAVISVIFYFLFQLNFLLKEPEFFVLIPESDIITKQKELNVFGNTDSDNKVYINKNEVFVDDRGYFSKDVPLQVGVNNIEIKVVNRLNKDHIEIRRVILEDY